MSYKNWPIRYSDAARLDSFVTKLAKGLNKKLSYVDVANLLFNHSDVVVDAIIAAESAINTNSDPLEESVTA